MEFEWDERKNRTNQLKHRLSFEEACQVFESENALELFDEAHSLHEDRFITIGPIHRGVIAVVWTEVRDDLTRIISARMATRREIALLRDERLGSI